jgi:GNAT superfamily N-acetyltransferase
MICDTVLLMTLLLFQTPDVIVLRGTDFAARYCDSFNAFSFKGALDAPDRLYIGAVCNKQLLGFAKVEETPNDFYLAYLEVSPTARGRGVGGRILSGLFALAHAKNKHLVVSRYTPAGLRSLHPEILRLQATHPEVVVAFEPSY